MAFKNLVNINSDNVFVPDDIKPLLLTIFAYHQSGPLALIWEQLHRKIVIEIRLKFHN